MKIRSVILASALMIASQTSHSEELTNEIMSGNFCKKEIYDRFKLVEKTPHSIMKFAPSPKLKEFVTKMELMCPWSVQRDFNGDKKDDWVGFVENQGKFQLIAYFSSLREYRMIPVEELKGKPTNSFVRWIQTKYLKHFTKKKLAIGNLTYALQVADLNGMTNIYLWDGKKLSKVLTTPQIF